jgi:hypothetical protein
MKLEAGALYRVAYGADTKETKTIPLVRVKGASITFKMGVSEEFTTQPTTLAELDTTNEISAVGFYNSSSLLLIDYLGYNGAGATVVIKGVKLIKISL